MNSLRVILNIALAIMLLSGGMYLLQQDSFFLSERWNPEVGTLFQGVALHCLASGLVLLAAFAGVLAYGWIRGTIPMPDRNTIRPHPSYKGTVIIRFWYLVLPAVLFVFLAFLLADKAPTPSLQPMPQAVAVGSNR